MTGKQKELLDEVVFSWHAEGLDLTEDEKNTLIDVLEGKRSYQEVLDGYLAEAKSYARL
ncbi:MAG: hypothetical protein BWY15_02179 [Firmicutes bacterium ADurb.Bin193]|nr:hypothetical protein [Eubacteriales bacterium]OQB12454.1 MAG: hypothetical protein BWY15_02179 [Firmicutes bacterium ADurb.Bin193]